MKSIITIGYLIACHQISPVLKEGCFGVNMMHHATLQASTLEPPLSGLLTNGQLPLLGTIFGCSWSAAGSGQGCLTYVFSMKPQSAPSGFTLFWLLQRS